jgi:starvation-inducible DNA-binding protein
MEKPVYMKGKDNKAVVEGLTGILADTFVLYYKTHTFHWNVVGENFKALHELFEEQYTDLWTFTDEVAERIRALDANVPINLTELKKHAKLQETGQIPDAMAMVEQLANDNAEIVNVIFPVIRKCQEAGDEGSVDMLNKRVQVHEKAAWMLRSIAK